MNEVCIRWRNKKQDSLWWNELCARIVEHFGLPGGKYTTSVTENDMKFNFTDSRDALMCKIMLSDDL